MRNRIFCYFCLFTTSFLTTATLADSVGEINIKFTANIITWTCTVNASSQNIAVNLGNWNSNSYTSSGSTTTPVYFSINLNGCNSNSVSTTFSGTAESSNNNYLALSSDSTAKNVAIEILNSDKTSLPLNSSSNVVAVDSSGNAILGFYAHYITTANRVQPGTANGDATFTINYD